MADGTEGTAAAMSRLRGDCSRSRPQGLEDSSREERRTGVFGSFERTVTVEVSFSG